MRIANSITKWKHIESNQKPNTLPFTLTPPPPPGPNTRNNKSRPILPPPLAEATLSLFIGFRSCALFLRKTVLRLHRIGFFLRCRRGIRGQCGFCHGIVLGSLSFKDFASQALPAATLETPPHSPIIMVLAGPDRAEKSTIVYGLFWLIYGDWIK